ANHYACRMAEILNSTAFSQELGVGHDAQSGLSGVSAAAVVKYCFDGVACAHWHRGLDHHDAVFESRCGQLMRTAQQVVQVGIAIILWGSPDRQEHDVRRLHRPGDAGFEPQSPGLQLRLQYLFKAWLMKRNAP